MKHQIQFFFIDCFMKYAKRGNNFCWNNFFVRVIVDFSLKKFMVLEWLVYIYNKETEVCAGNKFPQSGPLPTTSVTWEMIFFLEVLLIIPKIVYSSQSKESISDLGYWSLRDYSYFFFLLLLWKKAHFLPLKITAFGRKRSYNNFHLLENTCLISFLWSLNLFYSYETSILFIYSKLARLCW